MTVASFQDRDKHRVIDTLLENRFALIHLLPAEEGVDLPDHLCHQTSVSLKISRFFRGKIELLSDRIETDLLFGQTYYSCTIPYRAIWAASSNEGETTTWVPDQPNTGMQDHIVDSVEAAETASSPPDRQKPFKLKELNNSYSTFTSEEPSPLGEQDSESSDATNSETNEPPKPSKRPHLVRIK